MEDHRLPLQQSLLRNLGDGSYDRRKGAALLVQQQVKGWHGRGGTALVARVIDGFQSAFVHSPNPSHQKGGLIALAACSIGLMEGCGAAALEPHVGALLDVVLSCFEDRDARVKYYACEALYNIAQVARALVVPYFGQIFDGLIRLTTDVDSLVKKAAALLDRLLKDIVIECEGFEFDTFVVSLKDRHYLLNTNAHVRKLLLSWVDILFDVPGMDVLDLLPELLEFIFNMCGDQNHNNCLSALSSLNSFLLEVSGSEPGRLQFEAVVEVLCEQCRRGPQQRLTAITWLKEVIDLGQERLAPQFADILGAALHCISDPEAEPYARVANDKLWRLVNRTLATKEQSVDTKALLEKISRGLHSSHIGTKVVCLRWVVQVVMLVDGAPLHGHFLRPALLQQLEHPDDVVAEEAVAAIARYRLVTRPLAMLLFESPKLLETRGSLIIRLLIRFLGPSIFLELAKTLQELEGSAQPRMLEFLSLFTCLMSRALLTAPELDQLRAEVRLGDASGTFRTLFWTWCHNPVAALSLGFLGQDYELARRLVLSFSTVELTVNFPDQVSKLVQLLESPAFLPLRLELIEISSAHQTALLSSLSGLLLLLPQHSDAFKTLYTRLKSVSIWTLGKTSNSTGASNGPADAEPGRRIGALSIDAMLARFIEVRELHTEERQKMKAAEAALRQLHDRGVSSLPGADCSLVAGLCFGTVLCGSDDAPLDEEEHRTSLRGLLAQDSSAIADRLELEEGLQFVMSFENDSTAYRAKIVEVCGAGTYRCLYDDGDESELSEEQLRTALKQHPLHMC